MSILVRKWDNMVAFSTMNFEPCVVPEVTNYNVTLHRTTISLFILLVNKQAFESSQKNFLKLTKRCSDTKHFIRWHVVRDDACAVRFSIPYRWKYGTNSKIRQGQWQWLHGEDTRTECHGLEITRNDHCMAWHGPTQTWDSVRANAFYREIYHPPTPYCIT